MTIVGIDVGKHELHAALLDGDRVICKKVRNASIGFRQLKAWFRNRTAQKVYVCLEATGGWSEAVATYLHDRDCVVSIVNPSRIKAFAQSELLRTKTDRVDAALIARFYRAHMPPPWQPPPPESQALQGLVRRHRTLIDMRTEETNRRQAPIASGAVRASIEAMLDYLRNEIKLIEKQIDELVNASPALLEQRDLLISIPGIANKTAACILAEMPDLKSYRNVKAVAAFAGLSPRHYESGSLKWRSRLVKTGNASLRQALYFPAIVAMRHNRQIRIFADRLRSRGKSNMTVIAAIMRKLLTHAYGILKSGRAFDPLYGAG